MPKKSKYPGLRTHTRKGKGGQVWTYWTLDRRAEGLPELPLGSDYKVAIDQWHKLQHDIPLTKGTVQEAFNRWREQCLPDYEVKDTRDSYTRHLQRLEPVFGKAGWHEITLPVLRQYLDKRSAKTQGNRELSVLSIIWGKARLWGMTELHWPAMGVKGWKNSESARDFEVTDELFTAVYAEADQVLKDCMDIATATGMRLTDVRTVRLPVGGILRHKPSKTGKHVEFAIDQSPVLSRVIERRGQLDGVMLLCTSTGRPISSRMLRTRWDDARDRAALKASTTGNPDFAKSIRAMFLRDMRSRAADLAVDLDGASKLLQHSSTALTKKHYRTRAEKLTAVR